ncbi:DMT family transporter [Embleya scabrispora]|uniref:DMT family transporter n=1 Tax=Embleya scabrispora TaxID=159449 RepID=UPI0003674B0C|nr:DMT family transporter [Embleya scabrispora]MYS79960.1 EamA family transporter [Streptomyces sp. SID5474]
MSVRTFLHAARNTRSGLDLFVLAGVLWGTGGIAGSVLATRAGLHPVAVAAYRLLAGGLFVTAYALASGRLRVRRPSRAELARIAGTGALFTVFQAAYFAAVAATSVSLATLTTMVAVHILVTTGSAVQERRRPGPTAIASLVVAALGLALLLGSPAGGTRGALVGICFALVAAGGFAVLTLDTRPTLPTLDRVAVTGLGFLCGGCMLLPAGLMVGMAVPMRTDILGAVLFLGVVPTAGAYVAYFSALGRGHAGGGIVAVLLEPLTATVLAAFLQGERPGPERLLGGVLVLTSIAVHHRAAGTPARG